VNCETGRHEFFFQKSDHFFLPNDMKTPVDFQKQASGLPDRTQNLPMETSVQNLEPQGVRRWFAGFSPKEGSAPAHDFSRRSSVSALAHQRFGNFPFLENKKRARNYTR